MIGGGIEGHSSCVRDATLEVDGSRRRGFGRRTAIINTVDSKSHGRPPTTRSQLEELSTGAQSGSVQRRTGLRAISTGDIIDWQTPGVNQGDDNVKLMKEKRTQ